MSLGTPKRTRGGRRAIFRRASAGDSWDWKSTASSNSEEEDSCERSYVTQIGYQLSGPVSGHSEKDTWGPPVDLQEGVRGRLMGLEVDRLQ
ncbi:hypothetical protein JTE90_016263 [Oedothorax gibbosus]|uniref:Uncharacterized protein n=1 Tax=Oedothorax gibbosus TaxID=931172 RepID=A0AAV6VTK3_9ARAC|nr:hypothetical protein JTE90_016263 [Oedothorax gibbosus]